MLDTPDEKIAMTGQSLLLIRDASRLYEENAKLREYIEAMRQCAGEIKRDVGCNECPMYRENEAQWCVRKLVGCELGIEVTDE